MATPSCDEQGHIGRLLGSLQREGWGGVRSENCLGMRTQAHTSVQPTSVAQYPWGQGLVAATHHGLGRRGRLLH